MRNSLWFPNETQCNVSLTKKITETKIPRERELPNFPLLLTTHDHSYRHNPLHSLFPLSSIFSFIYSSSPTHSHDLTIRLSSPTLFSFHFFFLFFFFFFYFSFPWNPQHPNPMHLVAQPSTTPKASNVWGKNFILFYFALFLLLLLLSLLLLLLLLFDFFDGLYLFIWVYFYWQNLLDQFENCFWVYWIWVWIILGFIYFWIFTVGLFFCFAWAHSTIGIMLAKHGFMTHREPNFMEEKEAYEGCKWGIKLIVSLFGYILFPYFYLVSFLLVLVNILFFIYLLGV